MQPNILSQVVRWLLERIEHFPIPLEEALWAYASCMAGPPGHEAFAFPLPPCGASGAVAPDEDGTPWQDRWQIMDHDLQSQGSAPVPSPAAVA
ncbi:MAG: hypothetical protein KIS73_18920 [Enhydrobacter sp.]|nr:hypothetical protein [Enhydrobacter sp.]